MYLKNNDDGKKRWSLFPITHPDLFDYYKKAMNQLWFVEDVDLSKDNYEALTEDEKIYLKNILAFFAVSDGLVLDNIASNFVNEVDVLEAQYYYMIQGTVEQIHAEQYSLLIDTYIKNPQEQLDLFKAIEKIDTVKRKAEWAMKWLDHPSFAHRLVAFSLVEGLSFASVFAGVFWFRSRNILPGLGLANEYINRDETQHYEFALHLYNNYLKAEHRVPEEEIRQMIIECCEVEIKFVEESMPTGLKGLTKQDMIDYVKFVADLIMNDYGIERHYKTSMKLDYMKRIGITAKNNFFEKRSGEYTKLEIPTSREAMFDEEF
jgi:ribonucleoside-diphosphate reductase beta chain